MKKATALLIQSVIWIGIWILFTSMVREVKKPPMFYFMVTERVICLAVLYNLAYYFLLPRYLRGQKWSAFIFTIILFIAWLAYTSVVEDFYFKIIRENEEKFQFNHAPDPPPRPMIVFPAFLALFVFGTATILKGYTAYEQKKREEAEANKRRLEAELALHKSQINPHFLLNTLNNLYGIALSEPEKTPQALLKLSDMVRYILYECCADRVSLARDLDFIKNYISLQQLRLAPNVELNFTAPSNIPDWKIEPMILIPFIENAFKHGLSTQYACRLDVQVHINGEKLLLCVENQIFDSLKKQQGNYSGIGLQNTRQRLEYSYPNKHNLLIYNKNGRFVVELTLIL